MKQVLNSIYQSPKHEDIPPIKTTLDIANITNSDKRLRQHFLHVKEMTLEEKSIGNYTYLNVSYQNKSLGHIRFRSGQMDMQEIYLYPECRRQGLSIPMIIVAMHYMNTNNIKVTSDVRCNPIERIFIKMEKLGLVTNTMKKTIDQKSYVYQTSDQFNTIYNTYIQKDR